MSTRSRRTAIAALGVLLVAATGALVQGYPSKPVIEQANLRPE